MVGQRRALRMVGVGGVIVLLAAAGCGEQDTGNRTEATTQDNKIAVADIRPLGDTGVTGQAHFVEGPDQTVTIGVQATGLTPGSHGIHVHEVGDCGTAEAPGGHFDPSGTRHGNPNESYTLHHAGDLPMITANASGQGKLTWETSNLTVSDGSRSFVGRSLVIHADADDYTTEPAGNSGTRIACGVITAEQ